MTASTPAIEIDQPRAPLRAHGRRRRPEPARRARPVLRVLRQERRRQDDDHQVPAQPAAADGRRRRGCSASIPRTRTKSRSSRASPTCRMPSAFYPWMSVRQTLDYFASFRPRWNDGTRRRRCSRQFRLDPRQKTSHLSKGQRTQLALITAICPEPELLILDEPTSGLDPIVRREFIQTVIGAYQEGDPGPPHGLRLDASDLRVRRADRRVHDRRSRPRGADARSRRGARSLQEDLRPLPERARPARPRRVTGAAPDRARDRNRRQRQLRTTSSNACGRTRRKRSQWSR